MAIVDTESATTITVPADYLEDMRSALVAELKSDSEALRANQTDLVAEKACREDRDASVRLLSRDLYALDQVLDAEQDTEVTAERATVWHALEALCRLLTDRLVVEMEYGPLDMESVLELTARLRWAAGAAARAIPTEAGETVAVVLDRGQREALRDAIVTDASPYGDISICLSARRPGPTNRAFVVDAIAKVPRYVAVLDAIGWEESAGGDDERAVPVDAGMQSWARELSAEIGDHWGSKITAVLREIAEVS